MGSGDDEPAVFQASAAPDPPNLKGTAYARTNSRTGLDVKDLDRFHVPGKGGA